MVRYPYGSWPSPLSATDMANGATRMSGLAAKNGQLWWSESRPEDKGRVSLVRSFGGTGQVDVVSSPWSVRTSVHEYGGRSWWLGASCVYFVNWDDQRLYRLTEADSPQPLTPEPADGASWRYADGDEHRDGGLVVAVRETHITSEYKTEPTNELVAIDLDPGNGGSEPLVLAAGADFYAAPRFSPDGRFVSWIEWNHPQMPWDGTVLRMAEVTVGDDLGISDAKTIAGANDVSIMGADWTSGGQLVFSTDHTGFWNLERYDPEAGRVIPISALVGAEIGAPQWVLGTQQWVELSTGDLAVVITEAARDSLWLVPGKALSANESSGLTNDDLRLVENAFTRVDFLAAGPDGVMYVGGLTAEGPSEIALVAVGQDRETVDRPGGAPLTNGWVSTATPIEFASGDGQAHAFFYPPTGVANGQPIEPPEKELPPLIVMGHGGPTSHSSPAFNAKVQYWTSRGFAVADVNYRGSTGFGRDYRRLLNGQWGVADVEDCVAVAEHLAVEGFVDRDRMAIRGGSAGGLTVLRALQTSDTFAAGTSLYGVADLEALVAETHKFESRYLDSMIGPYGERKDLYIERSPIHHTDGLKCPLLVLQGTDDKVVPPSQSRAIAEAVAAKGLPHAYIEFAGEQHGFRQAETIIRSFEIELWFYSQVFGFDPADELKAPPEAVGFDQG